MREEQKFKLQIRHKDKKQYRRYGFIQLEYIWIEIWKVGKTDLENVDIKSSYYWLKYMPYTKACSLNSNWGSHIKLDYQSVCDLCISLLPKLWYMPMQWDATTRPLYIWQSDSNLFLC